MDSEENTIIIEDTPVEETTNTPTPKGKKEASKTSGVVNEDLSTREAEIAQREAKVQEGQAALAEMMRQMSEKMSKVDAFLQKASEQMDDVDGKKFDTTKPRPLTQKSLLAYINWLKIHKPNVYEKKREELELKLSKLN
jgi:hypothetical protein